MKITKLFSIAVYELNPRPQDCKFLVQLASEKTQEGE